MNPFNHPAAGLTLRRRRHRWNEADTALLGLIRLVLDEGWSAEQAASELRASVSDESVLRVVNARVQGALAERPTPVAKRAAQTLELLVGREASVRGSE